MSYCKNCGDGGLCNIPNDFCDFACEAAYKERQKKMSDQTKCAVEDPEFFVWLDIVEVKITAHSILVKPLADLMNTLDYMNMTPKTDDK